MTFQYRSGRRKAGTVERAAAMWGQLPPNNKGKTIAQKAGIRFERKVLDTLTAGHKKFVPHLPFLYFSDDRRHAAIPDGIGFSNSLDLLTIVEIKNRHTMDGWNQLNLLYLPVVQRAFPGMTIKLLEIVGSYEPSVPLPCSPVFVMDPIEWFDEPDLRYGIHIWSKLS